MPFAALHHAGQERFGEGKCSEVIDFHHATVHVKGRLDGLRALADPAAVHHDVDRTDLGLDLRRHLRQARRIGQIQGHHVHRGPGLTQRRCHVVKGGLFP